ncbi:uncharacterized protein LOC119766206 [Culex quinquefasciatus]|uniref:uncharacterized protein LOC119766206 n=1 Tax=Culex quinquefasciatus TaxID=7176 RepID=UPI0018E32063|nr:uncharacterized protein LOC119766206 [Culex quinquefasciatus]
MSFRSACFIISTRVFRRVYAVFGQNLRSFKAVAGDVLLPVRSIRAEDWTAEKSPEIPGLTVFSILASKRKQVWHFGRRSAPSLPLYGLGARTKDTTDDSFVVHRTASAAMDCQHRRFTLPTHFFRGCASGHQVGPAGCSEGNDIIPHQHLWPINHQSTTPPRIRMWRMNVCYLGKFK